MVKGFLAALERFDLAVIWLLPVLRVARWRGSSAKWSIGHRSREFPHTVDANSPHRGAASLSGEFSNYTPPYIFLMYLVSSLVRLLGIVPAIKLINVPFVVAAAMRVPFGCSSNTG
jgi:hypothetical protein